MDMTGEERINAPRDVVWAALNDPDVLKRCIPGCQSLEMKSPTELAATVKVKIGPVSATFNGEVTLTNVEAPESYTISGEGKGGVAGFAKGAADVALKEEGAETRAAICGESAGRRQAGPTRRAAGEFDFAKACAAVLCRFQCSRERKGRAIAAFEGAPMTSYQSHSMNCTVRHSRPSDGGQLGDIYLSVRRQTFTWVDPGNFRHEDFARAFARRNCLGCRSTGWRDRRLHDTLGGGRFHPHALHPQGMAGQGRWNRAFESACRSGRTEHTA